MRRNSLNSQASSGSNTKRRRILYLITRGEIGGAQVHVLDLVKSFSHEYEITLGCGEEGFLLDEGKRHGICTIQLKHLVQPVSLLKDIRALIEIFRLIRSERPDLVHLHSTKAGFLGRIACVLTGTKSVFTAHGWAFGNGTPLKRKMISLPLEIVAAWMSDIIITVSSADQRLAERCLLKNHKSIRWIPNGIIDSPHRADPGGAENVTIVMVARFSSQKDHRTLVKSFARIESSSRLILVGDGPGLAQIQALVSELNLTNKIEFSGNVVNVDRVLARAHIFVLSTHWEGLPISILEAMRAGLPIIVSKVGGVSDAVDNQSGILVPPGNQIQLGAALEKLIENPSLRARLGQSAREKFSKNFRRSQMIASVHNIYIELVN